MGVLDAIGEFGTGFTQGATQGLDLYSRFQEVQDKGKERQRKQALEQRAIQLAQDPKYRDDPIALSQAFADTALDLGDLDNYDKFTKAAQSARDLKVQKLGMSAFAKAKINPEAAISDINELFKVYGNNNSVKLQRTPQGLRVNMLIDGQNYATDYTNDNMDQFHHDLLSQIESYVMKPDDLGKLEVERTRGKAYTDRLAAETERERTLLPAELQLRGAQTQSALASAANASESAATERAMRGPRLAGAEADLKYKGALTEAAINPRSPAPVETAEGTIDKLAGKADELGLGDTNPLATDQLFLGGLAEELRRVDPSMGETRSAYTAYGLTQLPPNQLISLAQTDLEAAKKSGVIPLPDGSTIPYSPQIVRALSKVVSTINKAP